jgi:hypothetical protein
MRTIKLVDLKLIILSAKCTKDDFVLINAVALTHSLKMKCAARTQTQQW